LIALYSYLQHCFIWSVKQFANRFTQTENDLQYRHSSAQESFYVHFKICINIIIKE